VVKENSEQHTAVLVMPFNRLHSHNIGGNCWPSHLKLMLSDKKYASICDSSLHFSSAEKHFNNNWPLDIY
jgi:hypothetical protein